MGMRIYLQIREVLLGYRLVDGLLGDMVMMLVDRQEGRGMLYLVDKVLRLMADKVLRLLLVGKVHHLQVGMELLLPWVDKVLHRLLGKGKSYQEEDR